MAAMTDKRERKSRRRPSPAVVALSSLAAFLLVLTLLAFQVRSGHDPALSASAQTVAARQQPQVIVRKVEDDYVITKVIPAQQSASGQGGAPAQSPVTRSSGGGSRSEERRVGE